MCAGAHFNSWGIQILDKGDNISCDWPSLLEFFLDLICFISLPRPWMILVHFQLKFWLRHWSVTLNVSLILIIIYNAIEPFFSFCVLLKKDKIIVYYTCFYGSSYLGVHGSGWLVTNPIKRSHFGLSHICANFLVNPNQTNLIKNMLVLVGSIGFNVKIIFVHIAVLK